MKKTMMITVTMLMMSLAVMAQDGPKRYGIKSATAKMVTTMMGQHVESTSYFDDYGALEASLTSASGIEVVTLRRDGKTYMINKTARQMQEIPTEDTVNYLDLNDEIVAKYKIKEVGKESILDKECIIYELTVSQMGQTVKSTVSVWEGVVMKSITNAAGMSVTVAVTDFSEGPVDESVFILPQF